MKLFTCTHCGHALYFENVSCERCGHRLGYEPQSNALLALELEPDAAAWTDPSRPGERWRFCTNAGQGACNWLVPAGDAEGFCRACRHNEIIPPMDAPGNLVRWQKIERAKKRLFYSLLRLNLPLATRAQDPQHGLSFKFLAEGVAPQPVMTGHDSGVITIALGEADDAEREYRRTQFNEPYRTLLGHFRHEIGHHYWDILVGGTPALQPFRALFGDETQPYDDALQRHYANGAPDGWQQTHISTYATAHPWEDFAETWAHYLHLVDTTEMAAAFGVRLRPSGSAQHDLTARLDFDPYAGCSIGELIDNWVPLAALINNLNRAVGQPDAYPFVLTPGVIEKLDFIHRLVGKAGRGQWTVPGPGSPVPINEAPGAH